ncbi:outer membrane lipoprotein-sorting protein [Haliovirga abyssi]|uniref:Uncharacterized protein TP-0789 domain-containing protein n=1 Tax=Haliovirga abyssi TaxID=2996794 RepID=A0AAU9DD74_9FUSO|nr:outer membrane lipoprotein-sorting protein [Haliovirga abyssi]BDU51471.1 hypothetical protein HLVA_20400 [Haliovirga abyssi]
MRKVLFYLTLLGILGTTVFGMSAYEVMEKAKGKEAAEFQYSRQKMILVDKKNRKRVREFIGYSKKIDGENKSESCFKFIAPAEVKGTSMLMWDYDVNNKEDITWLSLPGIKKGAPRQISSSRNDKNASFMGSDFTLDDLGELELQKDNFNFVNSKESIIDGKECYIIESIPKQLNKYEIYSKRIFWIRKDNMVIAKVEYYDRDNKLFKVLTTKNLRSKEGGSSINKSGKYWYIKDMAMKNVQTGHSTYIFLLEINYPKQMDKKLFLPSTFYRK